MAKESDTMDIVVIGSSAASKSAVETLLLYGENRVVVITKDTKTYYSRVLLPNFIAGEIKERDLYFEDKNLTKSHGLSIIKGEALGINPSKKIVEMEGQKYVKYDKLIICTGASPSKGVDSNKNITGIYNLRDFEDAFSIKKAAETVDSCVVVGGGLVSLKSAWALKSIKKTVTLIVSSNQLLSTAMDIRGAKILKDIFEQNGINVLLGADITEFLDDKGKIYGVKLSDNSRISCGLAIIGKGVKPNIKLIRQTDMVIEKGIMVNENMETSIKDIYAAGDVVQSKSLLNHGTNTFTLWPDAVLQGRVAAMNILGIEKKYVGGISMNSAVFYEVPFISIGNIKENDIKECEVYFKDDRSKGVYRKVVMKNGKMVGAIFVGDVNFAGMVYWDIKSQKKIDNPKLYLSRKGLEDLYISRNQRLI